MMLLREFLKTKMFLHDMCSSGWEVCCASLKDHIMPTKGREGHLLRGCVDMEEWRGDGKRKREKEA